MKLYYGNKENVEKAAKLINSRFDPITTTFQPIAIPSIYGILRINDKILSDSQRVYSELKEILDRFSLTCED